VHIALQDIYAFGAKGLECDMRERVRQIAERESDSYMANYETDKGLGKSAKSFSACHMRTDLEVSR
jgi:hypothetical protein